MNKKIQVQFQKKHIRKSYDKEDFEIFEIPDFEFQYYEDELDQLWRLTDYDDSFDEEDVFDEDGEPRYIEYDEDLDTPGHRACKFLNKCLEVKSLKTNYSKYLVIQKNVEEYRFGKTICYTNLTIEYAVDLTEFQQNLKKSGFRVNFHHGLP